MTAQSVHPNISEQQAPEMLGGVVPATWELSEVLRIRISSENLWLLSETQQWAARLLAFARWSPSIETSCSKGPRALSHPCCCKSSWESQSWTSWIPCKLPRQAIIRSLKSTFLPSQDTGWWAISRTGGRRDCSYGQLVLRGPNEPSCLGAATEVYHVVLHYVGESLEEFQHRDMASTGRFRASWSLATTGVGKKWGYGHIPCLDLCSETGRNCHRAHFVGNNECMWRNLFFPSIFSLSYVPECILAIVT